MFSHYRHDSEGCRVRSGNPALGHALDCLAHPLCLAAALVLLLNAVWWQPAHASWLTGKLGDLAWLCLAPFLAAALVACLLPVRSPRQVRAAGLAGCVLAGAAFTVVKTLPAANLAVAHAFLALTGRPAKLQLDASDLLALPALWGAWCVWVGRPGDRVLRALRQTRRPGAGSQARRPGAGSQARRPGAGSRMPAWARLGGLALAGLAVLADSPDPRGLFIECLAEQGPALYGFSFYHGYSPFPSWTAYRSDDGGAAWYYYLQRGSASSIITGGMIATPGITSTVQARDALHEQSRPFLAEAVQRCPRHDDDWQLAAQGSPGPIYRFNQGKNIERSDDGGQSWHAEYSLGTDQKVVDARLHAGTGNLVVALNGFGVLVRTPDGKWGEIRRTTEP